MFRKWCRHDVTTQQEYAGRPGCPTGRHVWLARSVLKTQVHFCCKVPCVPRAAHGTRQASDVRTRTSRCQTPRPLLVLSSTQLTDSQRRSDAALLDSSICHNICMAYCDIFTFAINYGTSTTYNTSSDFQVRISQ